MLLCGLFLLKELSLLISRSEACRGVGLQCLQPHSTTRIWKNFWCLKLQTPGLPSRVLSSLVPEAHSELFILMFFFWTRIKRRCSTTRRIMTFQF